MGTPHLYINNKSWNGLTIYRAFVEYLIGRGLSEKSTSTYSRYVAHAEKWMTKHDIILADALPSEVADYVSQSVKFSHSSRGQAAAALGHYWNWKGRTDSPVKAIRVPQQPDMVCRAIEDDQARDLVKVALGWHPEGLAVLFGMYLALRAAEIAAAEWERLSSDKAWYTVTGKNAKTATLPVHPILQDELEGGTGFVFPGRFGGHVKPTTVWSWSKTVAAAAGIETFTTHQLRHTALTRANDTMGDLRAVQTFARHRHPEQTAGYTRTKQTRLREVSDSLDYL